LAINIENTAPPQKAKIVVSRLLHCYKPWK